MDQGYRGPDEDVIRITKSEAESSHVDALLARHLGLRGEQGVSRVRRSAWFYQNWFVFMLSGAAAAFAAWAVMEPLYDDTIYVQGAIEAADMGETAAPLVESEEPIDLPGFERRGWIQINGDQIWLQDWTISLHAGDGPAEIDRSQLRQGRTVGAHVEYLSLRGQGVAIAVSIDPNPPETVSSKALQSVSSQSARHASAGLMLFSVVAGFIGLAIGAADGAICRQFRRALLAGGIGLLVGLAGGFVSNIIANIVYAPLTELAMQQTGPDNESMTAFGFLVQLWARALAWCLAGMAMGLGQGIALRSKRLLLYGFLGGVIGGLLGGFTFDPIDMILVDPFEPSAHWSRLIGITVIGASVGFTIGIVELLARDAWLRMLEGPLAGKEFLLFKDTMRIGASPKSDIYLFNDAGVADIHAILRVTGDIYEIESTASHRSISVNQRPVARCRLRPGDRIGIGRTVFVFEQRRH